METKKILIIKFGAIGDCILTTPAIKSIRNKYPESLIIYLVGEKASKVFAGNPNPNEIIIFTEKHYFPKITNLLRYCLNKELINKLRSFNFDLVIDFESSYKSYYISALAKIKNRLGFSLKGRRKYLNFLYNYRVKPIESKIYQVERYLKLIENPPCNIISENRKTEIFISSESRNYIESFFANLKTGNRILIGLNPATLAVAKRWGKENFAKIADYFIDEFNAEGSKPKTLESRRGIADAESIADANVVFTWGPGELNYIKEIERLMKNKPIIAPPTNINQLSALIEKCNLFITNDTAPMHIAKALKVPTIAFFGPTDPLVWTYPDEKFVVLKASNVFCTPCDDFNCKNPVCMDKITLEEVINKAEKLLK